MGLFIDKKDKVAIEKIRQDEECREYAVKKNIWIEIMSILALSYTIPSTISAIGNNAPNEDKLMPILWSLFSIITVIEGVVNLIKLKNK